MKIALVQIESVAGDIDGNLRRHRSFADQAASAGAELIVFPELSATGYEPTMAEELAVEPDDARFGALQALSDERRVAIGVGAPTRHDDGVRISLLLFQPGRARGVQSKAYLHADEEPFFTPGPRPVGLLVPGDSVALAICYELSVADHAEHAAACGATVYLASVAKTASGVVQASERLSDIARRYGMATLMVNALGVADGAECAGMSSAWSSDGALRGRLSDNAEGVLIFDTTTNETALLNTD